jgi:type II restriction/modification system DNA methylase subunit YeeA
MNTKNLKAYAPKARNEFIEAVKKRAALFGIYQNEITPITFQGNIALIGGEIFSRTQGKKRQYLEKRIEQKGFELFIQEMAYTWFNRLAALRYMELHDYLEHGFRVLSNPTNSFDLPEILDHASDVSDMLGLNKNHITELQLAGNQQEQLYRELLLGQCHYLHNIMPFLFEALDDATELLLPDNLTKTDSILTGLINDISEEEWQEIEVIGWLYQFYISERKDAVIGQIVKSEDIPAATQLFTPNWIVKYLVQNSLGCKWLSTYPKSNLKSKMKYYIEPTEQNDLVKAQIAEITPSSIDPETIKVLDPAAGSGHILVEVYELLREIYLERGYRLREIPEIILTKNIFGLDIDDRAAQLAGFALMMKARDDDKRIFQRVKDGGIQLNIYSLHPTEGWDYLAIWKALNLDGNSKQGFSADMFVESNNFMPPTGVYLKYFELLKYLILSFEHAKTLGSLINIENKYVAILEQFKIKLLEKIDEHEPISLSATKSVLAIVDQAILLAQKYSIVCANPPYLGDKGMNLTLKTFAKAQYPRSKSDLFAVFIERGFDWLDKDGFNSMVTMQSWMFLSSYQKMREVILAERAIESMAHLGNGVMKIAFGTCATVFRNLPLQQYQGTYSFTDNSDINTDGVPQVFPVINSRLSNIAPNEFKKIPGNIIAYWMSKKFIDVFSNSPLLKTLAIPRQGLATMDNNLYTREWHEVSIKETSLYNYIGAKWFPYNKGGDYRKWYGNHGLMVNWKDNGKEIKQLSISRYGSASKRVVNEHSYFKRSITWSKISSGAPSFRYQPEGAIFDVAGMSIFPEKDKLTYQLLSLLNSNVALNLLATLSPTVNFEAGQIGAIPVILPNENVVEDVKEAIEISKQDWDCSEYSWNFIRNELILMSEPNISSAHDQVVRKWSLKTERLRSIEENLNHLFVEAYGVGNEILSKVKIGDISLRRRLLITHNETKKESSNLISELISYSVGCMMGRYSLDREGVVYADTNNEHFNELANDMSYQSFPVDDDGIVPFATKQWLFDDDACTRFCEFVRKVWGEKYLQENIEFVADVLSSYKLKFRKSESANDTIRRYFSTQFFVDHCKIYKKRPLYWLFSSGKEKAFECLVYLHRYNEGTLSRMRTEYVTPLMGKYESQYNMLSEQVIEATVTEQRYIEIELKLLAKKQVELRKFDEELKHYAEKRITLDLDDGVKVNYGKFGNLLCNVKAIHGKAV